MPLRVAVPSPRRLAVGAALAALLAGGARAETLDARYAISLSGVPVGEATAFGRFDGGAYQLDIRTRLTGLAGLMTGGQGSGVARGSAAGGRIVPASYALTSAGKSGQRTVRMALARGAVAALEVTPPLPDADDRVPVEEAHKRGIVDPVSALVMPAPGAGPPVGPAACERTLPIFDGGARYDVALSYAGTEAAPDGAGYAGPLAVCQARYVPIAGHRRQPATQAMADNRQLKVWLAPVGATRVLVPYRIEAKTALGTTLIEATSFRAAASGAAR